jgi:hypothetical protein
LDDSSPFIPTLITLYYTYQRLAEETDAYITSSDYFDSFGSLLVLCSHGSLPAYRAFPTDPKQPVHHLLSEHTPRSQEVETANYVDEVQGYVNSVDDAYDSVRTAATATDVSLATFLSRPVKINEFIWQINTPVTGLFYPWNLFFSNARVANRLSNFRLLQAKLHVKFVINGTPFHYGRLLASYYPMVGYDDSLTTTFNDADLVLHTQRMHVLLNPSENEGGELVLPMFWWRNTMSTTGEVGEPTDFDKIGGILLQVMNPLLHANGGTDPVNVSVFAWAEDVRMDVPTQTNISGLQPQSLEFCRPRADEYSKGPVSGVASAIANAAGKLKTIPIIGPYATATQIGMQAAGKIASLFGYSRPTMLEYQQFRPVPKGNLAIVNLHDDTTKLSMDAKQEITIDPRVFGGTAGGDEMEILKVAQVESYLTQFPWTNATSQEQKLFSCMVDPSLGILSTVPSGFVAMPAITFAATPFKYWRGGIKFRFQVVCSRYHKGRIKIVYDPVASPAEADYNTAFTSIIDISDTTDFEFICGWGQTTTYREVHPLTLYNPPFAIGTDPLFYDSDTDSFGNGTISVYCVNDITSPAADTNVSVNVYVSAASDFEVAVPDATYVSRLRVQNEITVDPYVVGFAEASTDGLPTPKSEETSTPATQETTDPGQAPVVKTASHILPITDSANLVHFGESIRSFRQLIKRYCLHESMPLNVSLVNTVTNPTASSVYSQNQRSALPFVPGYTSSGNGSSEQVPLGVVIPAGTAGYAYGNLTFLRYVTLGYAGWRGGIRYTVDFSNAPCCTLGTIKATRYTSCIPENVVTSRLKQNTPSGRAQTIRLAKEVTGGEGIVMASPRVNPVMSFEIPFYSQYRFMPPRLFDYFGGDDPSSGTQLPQPCWKLGFSQFRSTATTVEAAALENNTIDVYVAAAEDFNVGWYQGPPLFWLEAAPPIA